MTPPTPRFFADKLLGIRLGSIRRFPFRFLGCPAYLLEENHVGLEWDRFDGFVFVFIVVAFPINTFLGEKITWSW